MPRPATPPAAADLPDPFDPETPGSAGSPDSVGPVAPGSAASPDSADPAAPSLARSSGLRRRHAARPGRSVGPRQSCGPSSPVACPDHLAPALVVPLERLPLGATGKLDRRAPPVPRWPRPAGGAAGRSPRGEAEQTLAAIWSEVLGAPEVGADDNYHARRRLRPRHPDRLRRPPAGLALTPRHLFTHQTPRRTRRRGRAVAGLRRLRRRRRAGTGDR
ncbi:hypothetical protein LT493_15470 [Streptomyces tricolor]|nr:hypothetical protein [Streptomyces tricolor]